MRQVHVVAGGQYGSEAKGHVAGWLAARNRNTVCVRVGGPNAGHTAYGACPPECNGIERTHDLGHPWRLRQIPVAAVTNPNAQLLIAAGSEIDMEVLREEWRALDRAGYRLPGRVYIDRNATLLEPRHITEEQERKLNAKIGSTAKGIGAARAARIWREAKLVSSQADILTGLGALLVDSTTYLTDRLDSRYDVVIEGTQGYGLGLHTDNYPQVTSGDCRAIDFLAQAGLSPWSYAVDDLHVWVVARTYPIRVAGNSGPMENETTWDELGLEPEQTTVTKKTRRVAEWDPELVRNAVLANGGGEYNSKVRIALTMVDYKIPEVAGARSWSHLDGKSARKLAELVSQVERECFASVGLVGTGPTSIIDLR